MNADWDKQHSRNCEGALAFESVPVVGLEMEAERELIALGAFKNKNPPGPLYFVSFGPPGSGKSVILEKIFSEMAIPEHTLVRVLIDDYIAQFSAYSQPIERLTQQWREGNLDTKQFVEKSEVIYWNVRNQAGKIVEENVLQRAREMRYHVLKETTGANVASTLEKAALFSRSGYRTVLVYPFVTKNSLIARITKRAEQTGRFPDPKNLENQIAAAQTNFLKIYKKFDLVMVLDNEKALDKTGVLMRRWNTSSLVSIEERFKTSCDIRSLQQYIDDGSLIPEFSELLRAPCAKDPVLGAADWV